MLLRRGRVRRGLLGAAIAVCATAAIGVSSAGAAVTQTAITSPSSPFLYTYNDASPATVTISGTSNGTTGDTVDVRCYYHYDGGYDISYDNVASSVPVNADGTWSTGAISPDVGSTCQLRAVPHGLSTTQGLSAFAPVYSELDAFTHSPITGGSTASGPYYDYYATGTGSGANKTTPTRSETAGCPPIH